MRDDVAALGAAAAVAEPLVAYVALDHVFGLVQSAIAAGVRGYFLGVGEEVVVLERLFEIKFNSLAPCSKREAITTKPNQIHLFQEPKIHTPKPTHL